MMFSLRNFIKNGFMNAVGARPDYWIILNAAGWMEKGVLLEEDLADIQAVINEKSSPAEMIPAEELEEVDNDDGEQTP